MVRAVRDATPDGVILVAKAIFGDPADFQPEELIQLAKKNGLIEQLAAVLYPEPWIVRAPEPYAFIEEQAQLSRSYALLWLPGDKRPSGNGWRVLKQDKSFEIWQFRTD
jgi:hypothetical protein